MKIGVARPSDAELSSVRHHFIANHSIHENITAASFEKEALASLDLIFQDHDHAVVCGGTGLYIKALAEGLDDIPEVPVALRNKVIAIDPAPGAKFDPHQHQAISVVPAEQEANSRYFYELASARFGFAWEKVERVQAFHFKGGQGAKTGTGGHLPGNKVTGKIAEVRNLEPGQAAISPSTFHSILPCVDDGGP